MKKEKRRRAVRGNLPSPPSLSTNKQTPNKTTKQMCFFSSLNLSSLLPFFLFFGCLESSTCFSCLGRVLVVAAAVVLLLAHLLCYCLIASLSFHVSPPAPSPSFLHPPSPYLLRSNFVLSSSSSSTRVCVRACARGVLWPCACFLFGLVRLIVSPICPPSPSPPLLPSNCLSL